MKKPCMCRRDVSGRVLAQSEACLRICGNRQGDVCRDHCAEHVGFLEVLHTKKTKLVNSRMIGEQIFDIVVTPDATGVTTFLFKTDCRVWPDFIKVLRNHTLTKRELVVAKMIWQGFGNREISKKLYISLATVKTHINRIYSKLGAHAGILSQLRMSQG